MVSTGSQVLCHLWLSGIAVARSRTAGYDIRALLLRLIEKTTSQINMTSTEVYHLMNRQLRRGLVFFPTLLLLSIAAAVTAWFVPGGRPWTVVGYLVGILCYLGADHVRKRRFSAWTVSQFPQFIYWAHPTAARQPITDESIDDCTLWTSPRFAGA